MEASPSNLPSFHPSTHKACQEVSETCPEMMRSGQWDWNRPAAPLDRIILEDGTKVTLDNRRLDAALEANQ